MHLPVFLIFMPAIGAPYYGPLSVGDRPECFMDTFRIIMDLDLDVHLGTQKLKYSPKCTFPSF